MSPPKTPTLSVVPGPASRTPDGPQILQPSGWPAPPSLTGVVQVTPAEEVAACEAVYLHGQCADRLKHSIRRRSVSMDRVPDEVGV